MHFKLLLVIDRLTNPHAGTEGQLLLLINQLLQRGVETHLLVLSPSEWLTENPLPCPVTVLGSSSIKNPFNWLRLLVVAFRLRRKRFRLAHVFFNDASVMCPPVFWFVGIKSIISRRDMGFWYNATYKKILPVTGRFVSRVVTNSEAVAEVTRHVERIPSRKMNVIYNGYDRAPPDGTQIQSLETLKRSGAVIAGIVANIRPIKRMQDAVDALVQLREQFPRLHLVIIGAGDGAELQQRAKSGGVEERLHLLGSRPDVTNCLQYFDVGLLCSESEGFSNAIVEYQYAGLPVICSLTGGNPEAVEDGATGYLYPVGDTQALVAALDRLVRDPENALAMGASAKRVAEQRYSVEAMVENHLALYRSLSESH